MMKVLIVDDDESIRKSFARRLRSLGHEYMLASDAHPAMMMLGSNGPFDIVLTDYDMPEANGIDLAHQIQQRYPEQRVIIMSGRSEIENQVTALGLTFFYKTDDLETLIKAVEADMVEKKDPQLPD